jgi:hypothetical protein
MVLIVFGLGSLLGTRVEGRVADRKALTTLLAATAGSSLTLSLLIALSRQQFGTVLLVAVLGAFAMAVSPVVGSLGFRFASDTPTLASATTVCRHPWVVPAPPRVLDVGGSALGGSSRREGPCGRGGGRARLPLPVGWPPGPRGGRCSVGAACVRAC